MESKAEKQEQPTVSLRLVPANPEHFSANGTLKLGMLYFLKSEQTGKLENRPYYTHEGTNVAEFRSWFRRQMVYEAMSADDAKLFGYDDISEVKQ